MLAEGERQIKSLSSVSMYDVAVIGAGPYGLAAAAHLRNQGLRVAIFGKPLELWRDSMPKGMFLRSHWWASTISDPAGYYTFERFLEQSSQYSKGYPMPIESYIDYGLWFQEHVVPDVDETYVASIERINHEYVLTLVDGRIFKSQMLVMATGMKYYANRPAEYMHLSPELVFHTVDHCDFDRFADKKLIVVGGGQSAIEYAALLHEVGASVSVVARHPIHWLDPDLSANRSLWEKIKEPRAKLAPGWENLILERLPYLFSYFPQEKKDRYIRNNYQASANDWLRDRILEKVTLYEGQRIHQLAETDSGVSAELSDGTHLHADHVMLATGYAVDITALPMLHPSLLAQIEMDKGSPALNSWFESCVPGLYFVGMTALRNFGPLYRFSTGNQATAQRITRSIARKVRR